MIFAAKDGFYVDEIRAADRDRFVELMSDRTISELTSNIPYPYTLKDADWFVGFVAEETRAAGRPLSFCIRDPQGRLSGGCGFVHAEQGVSHRAEIGYWLGSSYWGRGIMSSVVDGLCRLAFDELEMLRVTANVFATNPASARVLQKCGFTREAVMRKHYQKNGAILDGWLYAKLASES